jgi:hypothetical protein
MNELRSLGTEELDRRPVSRRAQGAGGLDGQAPVEEEEIGRRRAPANDSEAGVGAVGAIRRFNGPPNSAGIVVGPATWAAPTVRAMAQGPRAHRAAFYGRTENPARPRTSRCPRPTLARSRRAGSWNTSFNQGEA